MITVRDLLNSKGNQVWSISPESSVFEALKVMADKDIGALLVIDRVDLVGVISERDYARKVILRGKSSMDTPVRDIMTPKVITVQIDQRIEECMELMTEKRIRHLPVYEAENLVGVISIGDVVKAIITNQAFMIDQLEDYITGRR